MVKKSTKTLGRLSQDEIIKMTEMYRRGATVPEIAAQLNRHEDTIKNMLTDLNKHVRGTGVKDLRNELHKKDYWPEITKCLMDDDEIRYFENEWSKLMDQLSREDVLHTDEMMVRELVLQDIDTLRIRSQITNSKKDRLRWVKQLDEELALPMDDRDVGQIQFFQQQISLCDQNVTSLSRQLVDSKKDKDDTFKSLKTTRDQRFKDKREQNKDLFFLLYQLTDEDKRVEEGRITELVNLSSEKIAKMWGQQIEYLDGTLSRPILNSETVEENPDG